jgi:hypothetical protein
MEAPFPETPFVRFSSLLAKEDTPAVELAILQQQE